MSIDRCRGILFTHRYCVKMGYGNSGGENYIAPGHHRTLDRKNTIWHIRKVKITRRKRIMKFEWIEEGDGRYRVQFLTWMKEGIRH